MVTSVKNQGTCAASVAFAMVARLELNVLKFSNYAKEEMDLSEQHMINCANDEM